MDSKSIYIGTHEMNSEIFEISYDKSVKKNCKVNAEEKIDLFENNFLLIDSANLFLCDGVKGEIWDGSLNKFKLYNKYSVPQFSAVVSLSRNTFILRCVDQNLQNILIKYVGSDRISPSSSLLQKQVDGLFCTDGSLIKVPNKNKIFYTYYYRNQFICTDTNLNLLFRGTTIDTNTFAKIKVSRIRSENQVTLASPPSYVNLQTSANEKFLFIHSALKSDNETVKIQQENSAIDIYSIDDGHYLFSLYLPNINGEKINDFRVSGNHLIALYKNYMFFFILEF